MDRYVSSIPWAPSGMVLITQVLLLLAIAAMSLHDLEPG